MNDLDLLSALGLESFASTTPLQFARDFQACTNLSGTEAPAPLQRAILERKAVETEVSLGIQFAPHTGVHGANSQVVARAAHQPNWLAASNTAIQGEVLSDVTDAISANNPDARFQHFFVLIDHDDQSDVRYRHSYFPLSRADWNS